LVKPLGSLSGMSTYTSYLVTRGMYRVPGKAYGG